MNPVECVHDKYVHARRVHVLCRRLIALIPERAEVLDVGCGDGLLTALLAKGRSDITIRGLDVTVRKNAVIPIEAFNGQVIPYPDKGVDAVMLIDTLHHTDDPMILLREARRVARSTILIKDHTQEGWLAEPTLRFMDWVGNARHGVASPGHYWRKAQWDAAFQALGVRVRAWEHQLGLYPWPANWIFERSLHFIACVDIAGDKP